MSDSLKSILFAFVLCVVCSLLLTAAATGLARFQQQNILIDKQANVLKSVGLINDRKTLAPEAVTRFYNQNIKRLWVNADGDINWSRSHGETDLPIYLHVVDEQIESYIIPINSRGLWGKILGYLAIEKDGATVKGFTVYSHQETPGLGGEIEKAWFQKNFMGKKIIDQDSEFVSIFIAKGAVANPGATGQLTNTVDGISGASLTGKFLTEGLMRNLAEYEPVSIRFRKNQIRRIPEKKPGDGQGQWGGS
ncbi:MAG: FMN-binding protein [Deltaproteobacteria bacterium]|nr:FMN-binding protein [Deltaproteobacteria bacterium]